MAVLKDNSGNTSSQAKFGALTAARRQTASKFVASGNWSLATVDVSIIRDTGVPTGDVQIGIFTDNAGVPSATQVGGFATVPAGDTSGSFTDFNKTFSSIPALSSGATYWVVIKVASGESDTGYYASRMSPASAGNGAEYDGATWTNNTDDLYYKLNGTVTGGAEFLLNFI